MTLLFSDGFDIYGTSTDLERRWDVTAPGSITFVAGRTGKALRATGGTATIGVPSNNRLIVGFAFSYTANVASTTTLLTFQLGSTTHITLSLNATENLAVTGPFGTSTGLSVLAIDAWNYVEIEVLIADSPGGSVSVKLNGVALPEITVVTSDTQTLTSNQIDRIVISGGTHIHQFDDLYIIDPTTGSAPQNTFLGNIRVASLLPTANGSSVAGWTANTGDKYAAIDETSPDDDTTYLYSTTDGSKETFKVSCPFKGTVYGIETISLATKSPGSSRNLQHVLRPTDDDYEGTSFMMTDEYIYYSEVAENNPETGTPWVALDISSNEWGFKIGNNIPYSTSFAYLYNNASVQQNSSIIGGYSKIRGKANLVVFYN